ncbi:MAG TPA: sigma-70 family RNA polymerase sigma factor [Thiothrix sp.]|nr:sigma-70 family RNA polymerase sigma factor [Thiothrix sp.]
MSTFYKLIRSNSVNTSSKIRIRSSLKQDIERKLERFLYEIRSKTLAFAVFRMKDEEAALDILQDTMIGFVKSVPRYEEEAWTNLFYKILTRRITDWQRKITWRRKLRHILPISRLGKEEDGDSNLYTDTYNSASNPAEEQMVATELAGQFETALQALPARQQEAYLLRQWQGVSVKETAFIMQCSEGSVKTHLFRAMKTLKEQLGEWIDET